MSENPDKLKLTIDGVECEAPAGTMVIEVADDVGMYVPRFCYHHKLSISASCRMCLVEVEGAPKPLPACATPVTDGMKVSTHSEYAKKAQKNVMDFLLINHPLDCPVCDQGGECELQDIAMGYGRDVSFFHEGKRTIPSHNIGPLIATEMTRCIHCTRCVRFGEEIAGFRELGATGRGMYTEIGTYVEKTVDHEMSGNVIDLCPVGALTAKPSRFQARAWEIRQTPSIAPHDAVGSNIFVHTLRNRVIRVVPRDNEAINEVWLSDRDRFAYEGLMHGDRLPAPMVKKDGKWESVAWDAALEQAVKGINSMVQAHGPEALGAWVSPRATLEEMYLLQGLVRYLGSNNIDHRLRQNDFRGQAYEPALPLLGVGIADLESLNSILLVGTNIRKEQPIIAHRLRKASGKGCDIDLINSRAFDLRFVANQCVAHPAAMVSELAGVASALGATLPKGLEGAQASGEQRAIADRLKAGEQSLVLLGQLAVQHPDYTLLRDLARAIAGAANANFGILPEAANTVGAWQAGAVPHRGPGGAKTENPGHDFSVMLETVPQALILHDVEPEADCGDPQRAMQAVTAAGFVVALTPFINDRIQDYADVILPITPFTETDGSFVNMEGLAQSFQAAVQPYADSRPGWKVYRVLSNLLGLEDCQYQTSQEVLADVLQASAGMSADAVADNGADDLAPQLEADALIRCGDVPIYAGDSLARRAKSLQDTSDAKQARTVVMNTATAEKLGVADVQRVVVSQQDQVIDLPLQIDDAMADNSIWLPLIAELGALYQPVEIKAG